MSSHPDDLIEAYLDGELEPATRRSVADHLHSCQACRDRVAEAEALRSLLAQAAPVPLRTSTAAFWAALEPALPTRQAPRPVGLGIGWIWGGVMLVATFLAHAVMLTMLVVGLAQVVGLPVASWLTPVTGGLTSAAGRITSAASWLTPAASSNTPVAADTAALSGEAARYGRELVELAWSISGWEGVLPAGVAPLVFVNLAAMLAITGLALAFLGWVLAARRRQLATVVAAV